MTPDTELFFARLNRLLMFFWRACERLHTEDKHLFEVELFRGNLVVYYNGVRISEYLLKDFSER